MSKILILFFQRVKKIIVKVLKMKKSFLIMKLIFVGAGSEGKHKDNI
jgi:hypothetical protein